MGGAGARAGNGGRRGGVCARVSLGCGGTGEKSQVKGLDHKRLSGIAPGQQLGVVDVSQARTTTITDQRCCKPDTAPAPGRRPNLAAGHMTGLEELTASPT
jgi:hypothetical protein